MVSTGNLRREVREMPIMINLHNFQMVARSRTSNYLHRHSLLLLKPLHNIAIKTGYFEQPNYTGRDLLLLALLYRIGKWGPERFGDWN